MNRKRREKLVIIQEGNVYVLDLSVKVPAGATASRKRKTTVLDHECFSLPQFLS